MAGPGESDGLRALTASHVQHAHRAGTPRCYHLAELGREHLVPDGLSQPVLDAEPRLDPAGKGPIRQALRIRSRHPHGRMIALSAVGSVRPESSASSVRSSGNA